MQMRKIINGRKYFTDTAEEVGVWSNGYSWSDFCHVSETLYRKRNGEYFLHGEGGPMTQYAESYGKHLTEGSRITPMSIEEAQSWAEEHLSGDEYEAIFGAVDDEPPQNHLRDLREAAGLSRAALADASGISEDAIASWELGRRDLTNVYTIRALAVALGCTIEAII